MTEVDDIDGMNALTSSLQLLHLVLFTVVRNSFEMSTEEFQCFKMVIWQLVDLRGAERQGGVTAIQCLHLLAAYEVFTHQPFQLL